MDKNKIVGKISVTARHIPSTQVIETIIVFEDRGDSIYYCWTLKDLSGDLIAGKCLPISKRIIDIDEFDFAINHSKFSIDSYRINRQTSFLKNTTGQWNLHDDGDISFIEYQFDNDQYFHQMSVNSYWTFEINDLKNAQNDDKIIFTR